MVRRLQQQQQQQQSRLAVYLFEGECEMRVLCGWYVCVCVCTVYTYCCVMGIYVIVQRVCSSSRGSASCVGCVARSGRLGPAVMGGLGRVYAVRQRGESVWWSRARSSSLETARAAGRSSAKGRGLGMECADVP